MTAHDAVTDSHEPSYYEIALTNRQVLVAFVVLLVCMLGAFFSGVWVGREAAPRPAPAQAAAPPPAGAELEEYKFFSEDAKNVAVPSTAAAKAPDKPAPAPPVAAAAPPAAAPLSPGTTLLSDIGAETPAPESGPEEMGQGGEPRPTPPAQPEPVVPAPTPPAAAPSPAAVAPTLAANEMVVQVFSSADLAQARNMVDKLSKAGYQAFLSPVQVGAQTMQRVRIGPYTDRARAQRVADDVKKKFRLDTWITR